MHFLPFFAAAATTVQTTTSTSASTPSSSAGARKLQFWGINESGAEFGSSAWPGVYGKDYIWYNLSSYDVFLARGMNYFRVNFLNERMAQNGLTGPIDPEYLGNLTEQVNYITGKGAYAIVTPHNYGRYKGQIVTDAASYGTYWQNLATNFASNSKVIFDVDNEFHDMPGSLVASLNQAAINGIRAAGATSQYITPEGNAYTGAWTWTTATDSTGQSNADTMGALTDPENKLIYQMHQYLDSDGSGTSASCVSSTIMADRLVDATQWLRANGKKGMIGEFAGGADPTCLAALSGGVEYLVANSDVWMGASLWAAGPWWKGSSTPFDFEPGDDAGVMNAVLPVVEKIVMAG
ncbi:hypothetical protein ANO11243_051200 [Dothideomycetidae sp. 11243]|nr:hypothetical protein ANO11243_051200 [fungal sp. No.11243]